MRVSTPSRWLWILIGADVMAAIWMITAGSWFDAHPLTVVITLGGHHRITLALAVVGFVILAVLAPLTQGFTLASRPQGALLATAALISIVALAGILSLTLAVLLAGLFVGAVGRLLG